MSRWEIPINWEAMMDERLGRVMTVAGSQITVSLEGDNVGGEARIGAMVKVRSADREVVGTIGAIQVESVPTPRHLLVVDLLGEIVSSANGRRRFDRGVSHHPVSGAAVAAASEYDLAA